MHQFGEVLQGRRFAQPLLVSVQFDPTGELGTVGRNCSLERFPVHEERRVLFQFLERLFHWDAREQKKINKKINKYKIIYMKVYNFENKLWISFEIDTR